MTVPAGFAIRCANRASGLSYHVNVKLPPIKGSDPVPNSRTVGPVLDIVPPDGNERHTALGKFLDAWSRLEGMMAFIVADLLVSGDMRDATLILSSLGTKQIMELLRTLAESKLAGDHRKALINFVERVGKLNTKRNTLVHGHWVLEALVLKKGSDAVLRTQFVRESAFMDPRTLELISDHRNQKERVRHVFTLKRIDGATRDIEKLAAELGDFLQLLKKK